MSRVQSWVCGQWFCLALGGLYIALGTGWSFIHLTEGGSVPTAVIVGILITGPGLGLFYGGYHLPSLDIHSEFTLLVARWSLAGLGIMIGVLALYHLQPSGGLTNPAQSTLILTALGSLAGFGMGVYDTTAKSRAHDLEERNRELKRWQEQLETTIDQLESSNERLDEFASVVSHDLRNPLNVAQGRLERAREECESEHLEEIAWAHDRIETLISELLKLAREGQRELERAPVSLEAFTETCWRNVATTDATLVTETDRMIRADRRWLQQVFENLFRNAIEHGGDDVTVRVGTVDDGFYVEDDGPGIPAEQRDRVFEKGVSTSEQGIGYGLSVVQQIVTAHGWNIRVVEGSDGGARFELTGVQVVD